MSTDNDHGGSLPKSLERRMQSVWTGATGWFEAAFSDGDGADVHGEGSKPADAGRDGATEPTGLDGRVAREIMTAEERMVRLVTRNDGGMKQSEIVSAVEWSESTVSRKLSKLESEGTITRYRIGREKLVFLPNSEPDSLASPWPEASTDGPTRA